MLGLRTNQFHCRHVGRRCIGQGDFPYPARAAERRRHPRAQQAAGRRIADDSQAHVESDRRKTCGFAPGEAGGDFHRTDGDRQQARAVGIGQSSGQELIQ